MPPPRTPRTMVRIDAAGQIYKQVQSFTYLGGVGTETLDMSVEIARWTRACWMRIRRYSRELYGQPKVALSLKTRMVRAKVIETLLYGCSTWTLRQNHYAKLRSVHHRVLLCGKSLSWMGLTRERWCCTRGLVSRLDMNTSQTSIKTDILFSATVTHIPGLSGGHTITAVVPSELNYEGNLIGQN